MDTSGISNPLATTPEDIYVRIWEQVRERVRQGILAVTAEIYAELSLLPGEMGRCIVDHKPMLLLDVGDESWGWREYTSQSSRLITTYEEFISEYNGGISGTIGINDVSIIALAKALGIPLVSMEVRAIRSVGGTLPKKRKIPDICDAEDVEHLTFNEFLRREGISG